MDSYISNHIDKNNLHHAYLIEGNQDIVPEIYKILETLGVNTHNNPDLCIISIDTFKIDDARNLNSLASLKGFSTGKKVFLISTNNFLLEAQNAMLKLFEEPIEDTHFFIITPNIDGLLSTFVSRFYAIRNINSEIVNQDADKFISLSFSERIIFLKELLIEDEIKEEETSIDSTRSKALKFLNSLEFVLHKKFINKTSGRIEHFNQFLKVREFLRQPGSSTKTLMESIALAIP